MVFTERIAVALLTVFLRSVFRRLPFIQAPIIDNSPSSDFMNPTFILAGGVFYYLTRNRCRSWIDRYRTTPNLRPITPFAPATPEMNRTSHNKIEMTRSWLNSNYRTAHIFQQTDQKYMTKNHLEGGVSNIKIRKRRWRNHPNRKTKTKKFQPKDLYEDPQPSTSHQSEYEGSHKNIQINCPLRITDSSCKEMLQEKTLVYNQFHDVKKSFLETSFPQSSNVIRGVRDIDNSENYQVPTEVCRMCFRRRRRKKKSENTSSEYMINKMRLIDKHFKMKYKDAAEIARTTRSGKAYGWYPKT